MRALQVTELTGPSALVLGEVPEPAEDPEQVRIAVSHAGICYPDLLLTRGLYQYRPDPPFVPGAEVAGTVLAAPASSGLAVGQRVAALPFLAGFQEVVSTTLDRILPVPDSLPLATAAAMPINYLTAHFALAVRGRIAEGEWVLVHGAGGGLGLACVQMARALGGRVIAVASDEARRSAATEAGADHAIPVEGFLDAARDLTGGRGVDIVADPVGGDRVTDSLRSLAPLGRLLVLGFTGGDIPVVRVNRLLLNNLDVVGVGWGAYAMPRPGYLQQQWAALLGQLAAAGLTPPVSRVCTMAEVAEVLTAMEDRRSVGKVVAAW